MVANSFGNKSCMQPMKGSACPNKGPVFFSFWGGGGTGWGEEFFLFFFLGGVAMPLAQAKNGDKQFWKETFHGANERLSMDSWAV
jgi:hypothetical protein